MRSEGVAIVLSFLIPGLGHMYAGRIGRGLLILAGMAVLIATGVGWILAVPLWIVQMVTARNAVRAENEVHESRLSM